MTYNASPFENSAKGSVSAFGRLNSQRDNCGFAASVQVVEQQRNAVTPEWKSTCYSWERTGEEELCFRHCCRISVLLFVNFARRLASRPRLSSPWRWESERT